MALKTFCKTFHPDGVQPKKVIYVGPEEESQERTLADL